MDSPGSKEALLGRNLFFFNTALLFLLQVFARIIAALPEACVAFLCRVLAGLTRLLMPRRTHITLNSLAHAFPGKSERWRRKVLRESTARLFEMGLFRPASAFFSKRRLMGCLEIPPKEQELIAEYSEGGSCYGTPVVIMLPHMTMAEAATLLPEVAQNTPPVHVIFRPLNQPSINRWVTQEREKFGTNLISRRAGYNDAMAALRRGEVVGVLFDQDASNKGSTITFMDRIVSATDLPALMAHRFKADVFLMLLERQSFWKAKLTLRPIPLGESPAEVTISAHDELERYLRSDANTAVDWLWFHDRWDHFYSAHKRFRFPEKRNQVALSNKKHGHSEIPRKVRFWVRLPNWLGDVVMALPVLRAIREARPDFHFTLIGKQAFAPLVERMGVADSFMPLPPRGGGYFRAFWQMRKDYPDTYLILTNSIRGDLEAWLTGCAQRFGMVRPGKRRPLLTHPFHLPDSIDESQVHQTMVWERMARKYGLKAPLDYAPVAKPDSNRESRQVGLICGTENSPEKRWPVEHWRALIEGLLDSVSDVRIVLFGTPGDRTITEAVARGFDPGQVVDRAGQTNLSEFCDELSACAVVCCNDTGGMHLANMLGTPVVAVFGPTNPVRTGPVFEAPKVILQPEGCPATGGMAIDRVAPGRARGAVLSFLEGVEHG